LAAASENDLLGAYNREKAAHAGSEALFDERVVDPVGLSPLSDESRPFEHGQVPGHGRTADGKASGDGSGSQLTVPQVLEDLTTGRVGERSEHPGIVIGHLAI
jgi:hypothetical protein